MFTDSKSNLQNIKKGVGETKEQIRLLNILQNSPCPITLHHTKSHQDNTKNNAVDKLCSAKLNNQEDIVPQELKGEKTENIIKDWVKKWASESRIQELLKSKRVKETSETRAWMKKSLTENGTIKTKPKEQYTIERRKSVLISRARTNRWTTCRWFLHFIDAAPDPKCTECGVPDTTEHVIDKCSKHEHKRSILLQKLGIGETISNRLTSNNIKIIKAIGEFLEEIDNTWREMLGTDNILGMDTNRN